MNQNLEFTEYNSEFVTQPFLYLKIKKMSGQIPDDYFKRLSDNMKWIKQCLPHSENFS